MSPSPPKVCIQVTSRAYHPLLTVACPVTNSGTTSRLPYLLPVFVCVSARPEEMCTGAHSSALIRLLQKFGCGQSALSPQGLVILFTEALHPLEGPDDQGDGSQLCFGIADFIFIQRKCLVGTGRRTICWSVFYGSSHQAHPGSVLQSLQVSTRAFSEGQKAQLIQ